MAVLAIAAATAVTGGVIGGPAGAMVGWAVGSFIGSIFFPPEGPEDITREGPQLSDLSVQTSTYGASIPKLNGTVRVAGNIIWPYDLKLDKTRHVEVTEAEGGKGGPSGGEVRTVTYTYSATFATMLCKGPIAGIRRLWMNKKLVYKNDPSDDLRDLQVLKEGIGKFEILYGTGDQSASSIMESRDGAGNVPAYRGRAVLVFEDLQLEPFNNALPLVEAEVVMTGSETDVPWQFNLPNTPSGLTYDFALNGADLVTANHVTDKIYYHDRISANIVYDFDVPAGFGNVYGVAIYNGDLYTVDVTNNYLYRHRGISADTIWQSAGGGLTGIHIYNGQLYGCASVSNYIDIYDVDWDTGTKERVRRLVPPGASGGHYGVTVLDGNLVITNYIDHKIYIMDGISETVSSSIDTYNLGEGTITCWGVDSWRGDLIFTESDEIFVLDGITEQIKNFKTIAVGDDVLSNVVSGICDMVDLGAADIDVSALTDTVRGYVLARPMPARNAIQPLAAAFQFDVSEVDYKLVFVKRGGGSVATITENDLAAHEFGGEKPDKMPASRVSELELPYEVTVTYLDRSRSYQPNVQPSRRLITGGKGRQNINVPLVLSANKARRTAEIIQHAVWTERTGYRFSTTMEYLKLAPADVATVDGHLVRITRVGLAAPGLLTFDAQAEEVSNYTNVATGADPDYEEDLVTDPGPTHVVFLDVPILRDADNNAGFYVAACGYRSTWPGCVIYQSRDGGASWTAVASIVNPSMIGNCTSALANGPITVWDDANTLNVLLVTGGGSLENKTELQVLNGSNAAAVGNQTDGWEIMQFTDADLVSSDGSYDLGGRMLRGRRGTDWMTGSHDADDQFVLLESGRLVRVNMDANDIGTEFLYKAVTLGKLLDTAGVVAFTNNAVGLECYSGVHVEGSRDGSNNLTVTWVPRTRIAGEWRDRVGIPVGEPDEEYEADIMDGETVKHTFGDSVPLTSPTFTYTAAQQTADGFTPGDPITVRIYQMSAIVGRGYMKQETV
jgi:hypothetical protein